MVASENLAGRPELEPIITYADRVAEHFSLIRGRTVIPPKSRDAVLGKHEALRVASGVKKDLRISPSLSSSGHNVTGTGAEGEDEYGEPEVSYIFHRTPASTLPLVKLSKVYVNSLKWCEEIKGSILVVRTLAEPCYVEGALCAVIEDEKGNVHNLRVYNVLTPGKDERSILPLCIVLGVKEPYCEAATEATSGVRVDHPSDLVYLSEGDIHFPDIWRSKTSKENRSEKLKEEGNEWFKSRVFRAAVSKYSSALHYTPPKALQISVLLNRSQAYIELGCFEEAAADAQEVIAISESPNEKALFRCGRALYALGKYDDALKRYEDLFSSFPHNREAKTSIAKCKLRIEEQRYGKYDWTNIISKAKEASPRLEAADYVGPILQSEGGLFNAKSEIKAGELLMCTKAFATLYPEDLKGERALIYDATRRMLGQAEGWKMTQVIGNNITADGSSVKAITPLQKGIKAYGDGTHVLDTIVDERQVVDINVLDMVREVHAIPFSAVHPLVPSMKQPAQGLGLWPLASRVHIKHSCVPNAFRSFLGDLLILRACRDIKKGEHITISHVNASVPLAERRAELTQPPGTPCDCAFCESEAKEGSQMRQRRVDLVQRVKELSERAPPNTLRTDAGRDEKNSPSNDVVREVVQAVSKICDELEATYSQPPSVNPRFPLLEPLSYLFSCYLYLGPESTEDAIRVNARYFVALGFEFEYISVGDGGGDMILRRHGFYHPHLVKTLVQQASVCWQLGKRRTADGWRSIAENTMEIVAGHRKLFRDGFATVFESLKWEL